MHINYGEVEIINDIGYTITKILYDLLYDKLNEQFTDI
jgi:hypothetical protein